jgi:serine protease Do
MAFALSMVLGLLLGEDPPRTPAPLDVVTALETAMSDAIAKAQPSVVAIARVRTADGEETTAIRGRNPNPVQDDPTALTRNRMFGLIPSPDDIPLPGDFGSGVVIGDHGEILTVYHIVRGAAQIWVRAQGQPRFEAEIIAADPRTDLAVIAPRESRSAPELKLTPLAIGDATKLRQGSFLVALGNPYNSAKDGRASASWGILSNVARRFQPPPNPREVVGLFRFQSTMLQLDSKLNLGMSGGAVINLRGELVGITTSAGSPAGFDAQAGYAIPMDALGRRAVDSLRQGKEVEYAFLGVVLDENDPNSIGKVHPGTPAAQGKLVMNDKFLEVGGIPVVGEDGLALSMAAVPVGQPVKVKVLRHGEVVETFVNMSKYPVSNGEVIATDRPAPWRGLRVDFTSVLNKSVLAQDQVLGAMAKGGVGVIEIESGSPADVAGLKKGQVITAVGGKPVTTPAEFAKVVANLKGPAQVDTADGPVLIK